LLFPGSSSAFYCSRSRLGKRVGSKTLKVLSAVVAREDLIDALPQQSFFTHVTWKQETPTSMFMGRQHGTVRYQGED